ASICCRSGARRRPYECAGCQVSVVSCRQPTTDNRQLAGRRPMTQRVLDVSALEEGTTDSRALLWWGNLGMLAIEGSMFMMALASYLYLKTANLDWPPATVPKPQLVLPTVNLILLVLTLLPAVISDRAAYRDDK